ncbi:MAG: ATP-binding cassette domain-containing protein [Flavonifractor plautii]
MTSSPSEVGRITLERVTFRYLEQSKRPVLDEVSASFDRSRITVLTGPSGCGKSTLLYLAAGIYPQNAGFLQGARCGWRDRSPPPWGRGSGAPWWACCFKTRSSSSVWTRWRTSCSSVWRTGGCPGRRWRSG